MVIFSLKISNVPQFLFFQDVRLIAAPRGNFSHLYEIHNSDYMCTNYHMPR